MWGEKRGHSTFSDRSLLRWQFRSRGEKDVEQDTIVVFDFEKFNADSVLVYPLDRRAELLPQAARPREDSS